MSKSAHLPSHRGNPLTRSQWLLDEVWRDLITPLDASTFIAVAVAFAAIAMAAGYIPARRAARVYPVTMLRAE